VNGAVNGAAALLRTAAAAGVRVCFANPGTTELPLVAALDGVPEIRSVLGLFEGVCTGAADGYARMTGGPALTLLHLGPGLANGLANLHDARRASSPVVNLVGEHASGHLPHDPALASDIGLLADWASGWVRTSASSGALAADGAEAIAAASTGRVATLIVPAECQWGPGEPASPVPVPPPAAVSEGAVGAAATALPRGGTGSVLMLGGPALSEAGLRAAARIAAATGARLVTETFPARAEWGGGLPAPARLPYFPDQARAVLAGTRELVLAGARAPVTFFGYPGEPSSTVPPDATVCTLAGAPQDEARDVVGALERLADRLDAPDFTAPTLPAPTAPTGPLTPDSLVAAVVARLPDGAVVVDEGATTTAGYLAQAAAAPRHTFLGHVGGAIGQGMPVAVGAAVAAPDRPVVALQADGSGLYTVQALWTQAREGLDVTTVVCANDGYRILQFELARAGQDLGSSAARLTALEDPRIDWVALARGFGVPARRVDSAEELTAGLEWALAEPGPHLLEAGCAVGPSRGTG
jgi:acetolactate synthase I/II/III large subunit